MTKFATESAMSPELLAKYEAVIGLEVHAQLLTKTKIFCGCSTRFGDPPNSNTCPVCLGLPGTLPVLNRRVVEMGIRAALALNCTVHEHSRFARKNYFYPDLPKGYQISQYELPLASGGWLEIEHGGKTKRIGITRLHLEEDAGKSLHEGLAQSADKTYVDLNRCGTPLGEIVSEPDMRSPDEAYAYLTALRQILLYTGVSDCNMEEGSLRCDANVSVRLRGAREFGTKVEVKNLNSFRYLAKALEYEIERHIGVLESGGTISQETRLWNQHEGRTDSMRSKEKAHDYRYFPEPDLLPVHVSSAWRDEVLSTVPELPFAKRVRFMTNYGLSADEATLLTETQQVADYFEATVRAGADPKQTAGWMQRITYLAETTADLEKRVADKYGAVAAERLAELIVMVADGKITAATAKKVLATMFESGRPAAEIVAAEGLGAQVSEVAIEEAAREVIARNPENIRKYRSGSEGVIKFLIGQVMRETRGQADPQLVNRIVEVLVKILGPAGGLTRESYEKILEDLQKARDWIAHHGFEDAQGRFSQYEKNIRDLIDARASGDLSRFVSKKGNPELLWSLVESMELGELPRTLRTVDQAILTGRLKRVLKGPVVPTGEDSNTNEARNIMFELALASFLSAVGFEVSLGEGPDLEVMQGDTKFIIECKRILSVKGFENRLGDACKQLTRYLDASSGAWGLIAFDVTKLKNTGQQIFEAENSVAAQARLGNLLETTLTENVNRFKKIDDSRIIGLLFYIHTPAFLKQESLLTAAKYYALWPLNPPGSPERKTLQNFAHMIEERSRHTGGE